MHHDERRDAAFCCHTCLKALQSGMLTLSNADPAFTKNGFSNWKNAMEKKKAFQKHESSDSHMEKQGLLSDLKAHIAHFPDGEFFRQLARG